MPKLKMKGNGEVTEIAQRIKSSILSSGGKCIVLDEVSHKYSSYNVVNLMFQKYYGKSSNLVYLSVLVTGANDVVAVDAYSPDGANTIMSRFSWGMDEDYICVLSATLEELGFSQG